MTEPDRLTELRKLLGTYMPTRTVDTSVADGLRLITAFWKVKNRADQQLIIELAERLSRDTQNP